MGDLQTNVSVDITKNNNIQDDVGVSGFLDYCDDLVIDGEAAQAACMLVLNITKESDSVIEFVASKPEEDKLIHVDQDLGMIVIGHATTNLPMVFTIYVKKNGSVEHQFNVHSTGNLSTNHPPDWF